MARSGLVAPTALLCAAGLSLAGGVPAAGAAAGAVSRDGPWLRGADYRSWEGVARVGVRFRLTGFEIELDRAEFNFYPDKATLCAGNFADSKFAYRTSGRFYRGKLGGSLHRDRFNLRLGRRLEGGRRERIALAGRRTGPRSARLRLVFGVRMRDGTRCAKTFRLNLRPRPYPGAPRRPHPSDSGLFYGSRTTVLTSSAAVTEDVWFRIYRGAWSVGYEVAVDCGPVPGDSGEVAREFPFRGNRIELRSRIGPDSTGHATIDGTIGLTATRRGHEIAGTATPDLRFGNCGGGLKTAWPFALTEDFAEP